jgi:1,4-alpha-glucan branching enzyme
MLKRKGSRVTFVLGGDVGQVSVVGDFNDWDPFAHPMRKRSNGTRSVTVDMPGGCHTFRYLASDGAFFDDPEADALEANGYGGTHSVVVVDAR